MDALNITSEPVDGTEATLLRVEGFVDTNTAAELERVIDGAIDEGRTLLVLQLTAVDYVSSAGWGVLISGVRRARDLGGDLRLVGMRPEVRDVFELLEFPSILRSHETLAEALEEVPA